MSCLGTLTCADSAQTLRLQGDKDGREIREIMVLRNTNSPYIVSYYGVDIHEGDIWLFIEVMQVCVCVCHVFSACMRSPRTGVVGQGVCARAYAQHQGAQ